MRLLLAILALCVFSVACKTPQPSSTTTPTKQEHPLSIQIDTSAILSQSFTGLALWDYAKKQMVYERNASRYFTPASNTKIYTFFSCLNILGDSVPALRYVTYGDSLIFWGTGDPTFLHPDFKNTRIQDFLATQKDKKLFFSVGNFTDESNGAGWSWADYNEDYQPELTPLPMYGNIVRTRVSNQKMDIYPPFFKDSFHLTPLSKNSFIEREIYSNYFELPQIVVQKASYKQDIPYKTSVLLTQKMLSEILKRPVALLQIPVAPNAATLYSMPLDSVYRQMMQISDNMLAEHLLFVCGATAKDTINSSQSINYIKGKYMADLPDMPKWADGSGLSRYNLFTPRNTVKILEKIYRLMPQDKLFSILPTGGVGTLSSMFKSDKPFVFAKSGSLSGVYNLSGYILTKQGKMFLFSFMNNNFVKPTSSIRKEVERILTWVHLNY
jgi:serine-type D-Ala-D-Ala carboxypeptidase/endopeptidase (penicillin-binding protein 4)